MKPIELTNPEADAAETAINHVWRNVFDQGRDCRGVSAVTAKLLEDVLRKLKEARK